MDNKTKKIAIACFIGGVLFGITAFCVAPMFWWLGTLAGIAGGYISYEFRDACKAVPIALRAAGRASIKEWDSTIAKATKWFSEPHPFIYPALVVVVPSFLWFFGYPLIVGTMVEGMIAEEPISMLFASFMMVAAYAVIVAMCMLFTDFAIGLIFTLAFIGARAGLRYYWQPFVLIDDDKKRRAHIRKLKAAGYRERPLTYWNVLLWMAVGMGVIIRFLVWTMWKELFIGICTAIAFIGLSAWNLFKLIHSKERILCALDGTLGGMAAWLWLAPTAETLVAKAAVVIFGGIIGAGLGVINYEFVSKRWLKLVPQE